MKNSDEMVKDLFERREKYRAKQKQTRKTIGIASGCLVLVGFVVLAGFLNWKMSNLAKEGNHGLAADNRAGASTNKVTTNTPSSEGGEGIASYNPNGVFIPARELPKSSEDAMMDMIGLIVYQGRIYTQGPEYFGENAEKTRSLIGDYLGTAKGNIDEWSSQEEYATELASTIGGEVYAVKGYDTGFRICTCMEIPDENGQPELWIQFYECLNGITLTKGSDLFEDRLKISGRIEKIEYQTHEDWDFARSVYRDVNFADGVWEQFMEQVNACSFVDTYDPKAPAGQSIYSHNQAHLTLTLEDGSVVSLRLCEGGYVGYEPLGWYFVKIPEEIFNQVYDACGGIR